MTEITATLRDALPLRSAAPWLPLLLLPLFALAFFWNAEPWVLMWALAITIFAGCKCLTWLQSRSSAPAARQIGFLFFWPGMDADKFLATDRVPPRPPAAEWLPPLAKIAAGALLLWFLAPRLAETPHAAGWAGMVGTILLLHFGVLHLLALGWQTFGVTAAPLMQRPAAAVSLADFWGSRWNTGFSILVRERIYKPAAPAIGTRGAAFLVFLASGLLHDFVISVPAGAGYGLPTLYFLLQWVGISIERSRFDKRLRLRRGLRGWIFTMVFVAGPLFWLFHPPFVRRVMLPLLHTIHAL